MGRQEGLGAEKEEDMILDRTEQLLTAQGEYRFRLSRATDISDQEGIRLELEILEEGLSEIEVTLYPLRIARPEFFPCTKARAAVWGKGIHRVDIPFGQFDFRQMVRAFLKYLDGVSVKLVQGGPIAVKSVAADTMGDFAVEASGTSRAGEGGEWVEYSLRLFNKSFQKRVVNVRQTLYGKECLPTEYEPYVMLNPGEAGEYAVKVRITEDIPPGGLERSRFLFVPEGDGGQAKQVLFLTSRKREHPYLFLKEEQWNERRRAIFSEETLLEAFYGEYGKEAQEWEVPEASEKEDHVYPGYSQNRLFQAAVTWKITGNEKCLQKALRFFEGFLDEKKGYLSTRTPYFVFVESKDECAGGDFQVCHAQSAGWVQEAEFFSRLAMSYDLLYGHFTAEQHKEMEKCLRNYMDFVSWRLTDGDGNNFQVAENGAGLLCAMVLQDWERIERFLYGYNGFTDLLSAVLLDDGMYFEEASGYVRLAGELFFDIANAAENFGISLKDRKIPASFDRNIMHSPWAMRETWAEDGRPFLGMSFRRFEEFTKRTRCLKDYFDGTARLLTDRGILFSINDSNEQDFTKLYQKAYYLYGDSRYKRIGDLAGSPETLLVRSGEEAYEPGAGSVWMSGAGFGILREREENGDSEGLTQAVLKFGVHGGYHGHFDRLSLASFIRDGKTFHNNEYAWYGYDSFLFKMWVQTSMAHNMTVVDGRMQKPSPCRCIYYRAGGEAGEEFSAVCAQTTAEWMDPPYGGQTPYPFVFPEEKCVREGRFILTPPRARRQGEIGEYSEPVFQRRLLILFHGYCILWDYLEGQQEHRYHCLYHPMGRFDKIAFEHDRGVCFAERPRFSEDPFGAGQFILNCHTAEVEGTAALKFWEAKARVNGNDIMDNMPESTLWRVWPKRGEITIGRYPRREDSFTEECRRAAEGHLDEPLKKTVSFSVQGTKAEFITLLEAGERTGRVEAVECEDFRSIVVREKDGSRWQIRVFGMGDKEGQVWAAVNAL